MPTNSVEENVVRWLFCISDIFGVFVSYWMYFVPQRNRTWLLKSWHR